MLLSLLLWSLLLLKYIDCGYSSEHTHQWQNFTFTKGTTAYEPFVLTSPKCELVATIDIAFFNLYKQVLISLSKYTLKSIVTKPDSRNKGTISLSFGYKSDSQPWKVTSVISNNTFISGAPFLFIYLFIAFHHNLALKIFSYTTVLHNLNTENIIFENTGWYIFPLILNLPSADSRR